MGWSTEEEKKREKGDKEKERNTAQRLSAELLL